METYCHDRENVRPQKFCEIFHEKIQHFRGGIAYSNFGYSGVKAGNAIRTKKALKQSDEVLSKVIRTENSYLHYETVMELAKKTFGETFVEDLFTEIMNCDKVYEQAHTYDIDLMYDVYRVNWMLYQGTCIFSISVSALGDNLEEAANKLKSFLLSFCKAHPYCQGFVNLGNSSSRFVCEERNYFSKSREGVVFSHKFGMLEEYNYMDLMFIDGLEWVNVFPALIAENIIDPENIEKKFNGKLRRLNNEVFCFESNLPVGEHKRKHYETVYPHFKKCLRPGFSTWNIYQLRPYWEDVFFLKNEYKIDGLNVIFSRGNFDFLVKKD